MGLDNYFQKDGIENNEITWPNTHLCGGMLSGEFGSFRGKVYDAFVEKITGVTLYEDCIATQTIRQMARKIDPMRPGFRPLRKCRLRRYSLIATEISATPILRPAI